MKKRFLNLPALVVWMIAGSILFFSCKAKDSDIQKAISTQIAGMPDANAVAVSIKEGVVTLSGECKDDAERASFETTVKSIKGVKQVINNITVTPPSPPPAPVVITADDALTKSVADATKDFPSVKTAVKDGVITLTGEIKRTYLPKLMMSLNMLKPKKIDNQLTIK